MQIMTSLCLDKWPAPALGELSGANDGFSGLEL